MSQPFYRATLHLHRVDSHTDRYSTTEISAITVTGATPADAMVQACAHADSLYEWHQQQADLAADEDPQPVITHMRIDGDALNKAMAGLFRGVLGKQEAKPPTPGGPISVRKCRHCGETIWLMQGPGGQEWQHQDNLHEHEPEPADEPPFVACKAPDPNQPNHFCRLRLHDSLVDCDYVPVDQLPDSADDEGDDKCGAVSPFGGTGCIKPARHLEAGDPVHDDGEEPATACGDTYQADEHRRRLDQLHGAA